MRTPNGKYPSFFDIFHELCYEVEEIWKKVSIPIVTHAQTIVKLRSFHNKYNKILKTYRRERIDLHTSKNYQTFTTKLTFYLISANVNALI